MGFMQFNYRSEYVSQTDVTVVYPTNNLTIYGDKISNAPSDFPQSAKFEYKEGMKFQTIWLLHGGGDDDLTSYKLTSLERYAEENMVMLVTASVRNSMYVNSATGTGRVMDYLTKELPLVIRSLFASSEKREDNFIVGSAMGGNGALGIGLINPEMYSAIVDLSGGIGLTLDREVYKEQMSWMGGGLKRTLLDVDKFENTEHDLYYIAKKNLEEGKELPEIFIGVGEKDFIQYRVKKDYLILKDLGYNVHYDEAKGLGHEWDFWDMYFEKALSQWLPLKREPIYPEE